MGAKRSEEMKLALRLVLEQGKTQAEAARAAGITQGALSQTPEIRERNRQRREGKHGTQK